MSRSDPTAHGVLIEIQAAAKEYACKQDGPICDKVELLRRNLGCYIRSEGIVLDARLNKELLFPDSRTSANIPVQSVTRYYSNSTINDAIETEQNTVFGYSKDMLPLYKKAELIIYPKQKITKDISGAKIPCSEPKTIPDQKPAIDYERYLSKPSNPHSLFQEHIYNKFLYSNSGLFVSGDWFRTWRYYNPDQFGDMYRKISKIFHSLYSTPVELTAIEIILIDNLIHDYLLKQFGKYKFYNFDLPFNAPLLTFNTKDDLIYVELTEKYHEIANGVVANYMKHKHNALIEELNQKANRVVELECENKEHLQSITAKDAEILTKDVEKQNIKIELDMTQGKLDMTQGKLDTTKSELEKTQSVLTIQDELIYTMSVSFAELQEQLRVALEQLACTKGLESSIEELMSVSSDMPEKSHCSDNIKPSSVIDGFFSEKETRQRHALSENDSSYTSGMPMSHK